MRRLQHRFLMVAGIVLAALAGAAHASGETAPERWPSKPVHIVVPYPPGAATDMLTRRLAQQLTVNLGQQFIVENRPGASGLMGTDQVSRAAPDGYMLVLGNNSTHGIAQLVSNRKVFDPIKDFTAITLAAAMPLALAVHPSVPAHNAAELVAWAKANPGKAAYGSAGTGSPHHIAGEMLSQVAGGSMTHVPYRGSGPSVVDLIGGQIPIVFAALATVIPHAKAGKVRILGLAENERAKSAPNVPTIGESVPGFAMPATWLGYFAPPNMPPALADRINAELVKALNEPAVASAINEGGMQVLTSTRAELVGRIQDDMARIARVVKAANITIE